MRLIKTTHSHTDGTEKFLFCGTDGAKFESACFLSESGRMCCCISSQAGCSHSCMFCLTGKSGFVRNLMADEITGQVAHIKRHLRETNRKLQVVAFMGMGEPLLNYVNVRKSIYSMLQSHRHIVVEVSTVGILKYIKLLANEEFGVNLSVSLHSPVESIRAKIIPNPPSTIKKIMEASSYYAKTTHRTVTFTYMLIEGVNDSYETIMSLKSLLAGTDFRLRLTTMNEADGINFTSPPDIRVDEVEKLLHDAGVNAHRRSSKGRDIGAACGHFSGLQ